MVKGLLILFIFFLGYTNSCLGQNSKLSTYEDVYILVDQEPEFPGGEKAMWLYFNQILKANQYPINFGLTVSLIIDKQGNPKNVELAFGVNSNRIDIKFEQIAIDAVRNMPAWTPGIKDNRPVNVRLNIPIFINE